MTNLQTGSLVDINGKKYLAVRNPYDTADSCQLSPCLVLVDINGNVFKFIKTQEDLDEVLSYDVLEGVSKDLN